jgi:signal transduction histidine kinase/CheY-like chemotaxis protein
MMMKGVMRLKRKMGKKYAAIGLTIGIILAVICVLAGYAYHTIDTWLFYERSSHLEEITEKIALVVDTIIDSMQKQSDSMAQLFSDSRDVDDVSAFLQKSGEQININDDTAILAFTEQGISYCSDGHRTVWRDRQVLISSQEQEVVIDLLPYDREHLYMIFFQKLDSPKEINNEQFTHVAVAKRLDDLSEEFSVSRFGEHYSIYIINESGIRIYRNTYSRRLFDGYNLMASMKDLEYLHGGSYEQLQEKLESAETSSMEYKDSGGERYYVSLTSLSANNWSIMVFVPTDIIGKYTVTLLRIVLIYFIVIAFFVCILIVSVEFFSMKSKNNSRLLKQQQESNVLLEEAAVRAEEASSAKSEFLSRMSHDIRTPINGIMGMTAIAMQYPDDEEKVVDCLKKIDSSSRHLLSLVNDVLDMSRIENGKTEISCEPMDILDTVEECASIIDGQLINRDIVLLSEFGGCSHTKILGDELHLKQIFINILGNAVKFTPEGGRIYFRAWETYSDEKSVKYHFEIEDTGIGMNPSFIDHIWEAFSQEDGGSRTTFKGTGLGMAITKKFVDMMDGTITVESRLDIGSKFTIELEFDIDKSQEHASEAQEGEMDISGLNVLLVEDNEINAEIAEVMLETRGVTTTLADNGKTGVEIFESNPPGTFDVILMDIMMPVMNGLEASRAIRAFDREDAKKIVIIAMTANAYDEDIRAALDAGMDAHVAKPIDMSKLIGLLAQYKSGFNGRN